MPQRSEKCFIHGVCLSLKRGLSCFIAHTPSAVIFVLVGAETKQLFRATHIFVEEFATIELMCLAYFPQQSKTDQIISLTSPYYVYI